LLLIGLSTRVASFLLDKFSHFVLAHLRLGMGMVPMQKRSSA